ncbi:hypothetical protein E3O57_05010 [Cryobacterium sp. TMN-39-2]|nr:hypothetical protein C3B60_00160 [Cryobacterium zongtaii]TFC47197.1 hypothetical protein E3O57_05010 [Cryobacterium sp. TMN-39-2]
MDGGPSGGNVVANLGAGRGGRGVVPGVGHRAPRGRDARRRRRGRIAGGDRTVGVDDPGRHGRRDSSADHPSSRRRTRRERRRRHRNRPHGGGARRPDRRPRAPSGAGQSVTAPLLLAIAGLAVLDSFNPATIVAVTLILLAAPRRPVLTALATVLGAALTVFGAGAALFLGAGAASGAVDGIVQGIRYVAFAAAGLVLILAGIRRFRTRPRTPIALPAWFTPWTALPFGALLTGADLPNAFPYFIAIERLLNAGVTTGAGLLILAGYAVIYCLPCLVLLTVGILSHRRTHALLSRITTRLGTGDVTASPVIAVALILLGGVVASLPFWALR